MPWREGRDGDTRFHTERLLPSWWLWAAALGVIAMVSVAYGSALGSAAGWLMAGAGTALAVWLLLATAPVVHVDDRVLRVGRARLPLAHVGRVLVLDAELSAEARSTRLDPRAYLLLRTATCPMSLMVEVVDPDDPHPYWLFSAKHPQEVATALRLAVEGDKERSDRAHSREGPQ
jgi:hypothetical protein